MTFREFADIYKERHAVAKKLSLARTIDWRIRRCWSGSEIGRWPTSRLPTLKTSSQTSASRASSVSVPRRCLTPASINRTIELLRHMLNWAVAREYLEKTPFRRGTDADQEAARGTSAAGLFDR
jgi:hypothetical protein